jgi:hypothetical protein
MDYKLVLVEKNPTSRCFLTPTYRELTRQTLGNCQPVFEEEFDCVRE